MTNFAYEVSRSTESRQVYSGEDPDPAGDPVAHRGGRLLLQDAGDEPAGALLLEQHEVAAHDDQFVQVRGGELAVDGGAELLLRGDELVELAYGLREQFTHDRTPGCSNSGDGATPGAEASRPARVLSGVTPAELVEGDSRPPEVPEQGEHPRDPQDPSSGGGVVPGRVDVGESVRPADGGREDLHRPRLRDVPHVVPPAGRGRGAKPASAAMSLVRRPSRRRVVGEDRGLQGAQETLDGVGVHDRGGGVQRDHDGVPPLVDPDVGVGAVALGRRLPGDPAAPRAGLQGGLLDEVELRRQPGALPGQQLDHLAVRDVGVGPRLLEPVGDAGEQLGEGRVVPHVDAHEQRGEHAGPDVGVRPALAVAGERQMVEGRAAGVGGHQRRVGGQVHLRRPHPVAGGDPLRGAQQGGETSDARSVSTGGPGRRRSPNPSAGMASISFSQYASAGAGSRDASCRTRSEGRCRTGAIAVGRRATTPAQLAHISRLSSVTVHMSTARWFSTTTACRGTPSSVMMTTRIGHSSAMSNPAVPSRSTTSAGMGVPSFSADRTTRGHGPGGRTIRWGSPSRSKW